MSRLKEELSSFPSTASTSQEVHESNSESTSSRKLRVTLLSSGWRSTKGGLSTINRELAVQLAKHPSVEVSVYLPQCSEEDTRVAASHNVQLIEAEEMPGYDPVDWLSFLPENHSVDCVIGHGAVLGRQVQGIRRQCKCKWIQVVHTAPEELGMYKSYADAISKGEKKHQAEVKLCEKADQVVAVGPKLAEAFSGYLRSCGKDQDVLNLTPGIFSEFADVRQATEERRTFSVLVFGRGDNKDFWLKGYDIAARAIAKLKDEPQPYKLLFVGAPSGEEEKVADLLLEQDIDRSQLTVRCFDERREQLTRLFREVDLAIMPSRTEGFGLAALEALSAGLPVLVSENSGLGEALKKVSFGSHCVVKSENPEAWASAIRIIREKDREMRLDESKTLREKYAIKHNWQDHCNRLIEIMRNISQGSSEGVQPVKKGKRPLPPSGVPDPNYPRLPTDEEESCPTAPVDYRKDCVSDNQCVAEEEQAHGHSVLSAEKLDIQIDCDAREQGASPTQNVNLEENVATKIYPTTQQVMNLIAAESFKTINPSNPDELIGFHRYLRDTRQLLIVDNKMGSLIITVRCSSLRILDELWEDYRTGHLKEVAQRYLVTEDILKQLSLDSVQLTLTISEEEYIAYRKNFLKNEGGMSMPSFEQTAETGMLSNAGEDQEVVETVLPMKAAKEEVVDVPEDETEVEDNTYVGERRSVITRKIVTSEGTRWTLKPGNIHLIFHPNAVSEPTSIVVYRWKSSVCSPPLQEHEAIDSNVIELSSQDGQRLKFSAMVTLSLSHSAPDLRGYELVIKRQINKETNEWEDVSGTKDLRCRQDIEDERPSHKDIPNIFFPVAQADINECSTYAVVCRLKSSPSYTITSTGGLFIHPDYPGVTVTIPENAVAPKSPFTLELKVQEVPNKEFEEEGVFLGPILRIKCFEVIKFFRPVTIQLPVSLRDRQDFNPDPTKCHVRVLFLNCEEEKKEWTELTDLVQPAQFDGSFVRIQVQRFSGYSYLLDWRQENSSVERIFGYMTRLIRKPLRPASFFAYFRPDFPEILRLICCHTHLTRAVIQDLENRDVIYAYGSSKQDMIPGEDKAFVFVSGGICPFDDEDVDDVYLRLLEDEFKTELRVRVVKYEDPAKIEFHNTLTTTGRKSLLCKFHLPIQKIPLAARHGPMEHAQEPEIKDGIPTPDELEGLSRKIGDKWKNLGRKLQFDEAQITEHDQNNNKLSEKAYKLLIAWKGRDASAATYRVLHKSLSDVERRDLAQEFCCQ